MSAIEILRLLHMSWPGVIIVAIWRIADVMKVWLSSRRVLIPIGNRHIDAPSEAVALRCLMEYERMGGNRRHAQLPPIDPQERTADAAGPTSRSGANAEASAAALCSP